MKQQKHLLYLISFIKDINFIPVILAPLVIFHNLSLSDLVLIITTFRLTQMFFSLPMGLLADYFGPIIALKYAVVFSLVGVLFVVPDNLHLINFLLFNFFSALSISLLSPASSKFLKILEPDGDAFSKNYTWTLALRRLGIMISGLGAAALIFYFNFKLIIYSQVFLNLLVLFLCFKLHPLIQNQSSLDKITDHLFKGLKIAPYFNIIKVALASCAFFMTVDIFIQPLLVEANVEKWVFPFILAFVNFCVFISLSNMNKINNFLNLNFYQGTLIPLIPIFTYFIFQNVYISLASFIFTISLRGFSVKESVNLVNSNSLKYQGINDALVNTFSTGFTASFSLIFSFALNYYSLSTSAGIIFIGFSCCLILFKFWENIRYNSIKTI